MKAIILMGGFGTRLRPITYGTPKSLLPIANLTFLRRSLLWFAGHGVRDFVFALSNHAAPIIGSVKALQSSIGFEVEFRIESEPLGSGGALRNAADLIDDTAILYNGDILTDLDLGDLVAFHKRSGAQITATFNEVDDPTHYGVPELDARQRVLGWQEKPARGEAKSRYGNVGVWVVEPAVIDHIPRNRMVSLETEIFPRLIRGGVPFFGYILEGYWKDIGTIAKYVDANRDVLSGKVRGQAVEGRLANETVWVGEGVHLPESCEIVGPVVIGPGTTIGEGVRIAGPTVIGANCVIEDSVAISESILWEDARIGARTRIESAVIGSAAIGAGSTIHRGCVIASDSRIDDGAYLAPGSLLGPGSSLAIGRS